MTIRDTLAGVQLGAPAVFQNLTVFPLLGPDTHAADYLTLDEALAAKSARVTEVSEGGSVPELRFVNDGDKQVLLMDGEEVVGAKQNRTLNISILAKAHSTLLLPVTCVEAGRWAHASAEFSVSANAHYAAGRARKQSHVSESLAFDNSRRADQGEVWADIDRKATRMAAHSPTRAMAEMYTQHQTGVDEFVRGLPAQSRQRGAIFAIGDSVIGCDLFDCDATFGKLLPKIVRSYALDALDTAGRRDGCPAPAETAAAFLQSVSLAQTQSFAAIGLGEDLRLQGTGLTGGALAAEGRIVHLAAFVSDAPAADESEGISLTRASQRRRNHQQGPTA